MAHLAWARNKEKPKRGCVLAKHKGDRSKKPALCWIQESEVRRRSIEISIRQILGLFRALG